MLYNFNNYCIIYEVLYVQKKGGKEKRNPSGVP